MEQKPIELSRFDHQEQDRVEAKRTRTPWSQRRLLREQAQNRFRAGMAQRHAMQMRAAIANLAREVESLDCDINAQLEKAPVAGSSRHVVLMLVKALTDRRDNLKATIASLTERLTTLENSAGLAA